jgi:hypothetical protein
VSTKTGGTEDEDDWVHDGLETHDGDQADDTSDTVKRSNEDDHEESTESTSGEEDGSRDDGKKSDTDESADGEGDETVRQELRSLRVLEEGDIVSVVEEEGTNGDLGTDVEELGDETSDGSDLLPERLVEARVGTLSVGKSLSLGLESLLGNLGELGEEEGETDNETETGNSHVDVLDSGEIVGVCSREEILGGDQWSRERGDTVERLGELKS